MNTSKYLAYAFVGLSGLITLLTAVTPLLPNPWGGLAAAILAVLGFYHIGQSHTQAALGKAGYVKKF